MGTIRATPSADSAFLISASRLPGLCAAGDVDADGEAALWARVGQIPGDRRSGKGAFTTAKKWQAAMATVSVSGHARYSVGTRQMMRWPRSASHSLSCWLESLRRNTGRRAGRIAAH